MKLKIFFGRLLNSNERSKHNCLASKIKDQITAFKSTHVWNENLKNISYIIFARCVQGYWSHAHKAIINIA